MVHFAETTKSVCIDLVKRICLQSIWSKKGPMALFWNSWCIQLKIDHQTFIEPKPGGSYMNNEVKVHG